jgi:hypothetical protein
MDRLELTAQCSTRCLIVHLHMVKRHQHGANYIIG